MLTGWRPLDSASPLAITHPTFPTNWYSHLHMHAAATVHTTNKTQTALIGEGLLSTHVSIGNSATLPTLLAVRGGRHRSGAVTVANCAGRSSGGDLVPTCEVVDTVDTLLMAF